MATLHFKGKSAVWNHHLSVPYHTLEKDDKKSLKGENSDENFIIEGDNLLALKSLLPQYQGQVKCIYIDPPYNTGNESWVYNDNVNSPTVRDWIGKVVGKEDLTRHDKWLCMITPRLKLLFELLTEDGVILVSIDENEHANLRAVMNDIFQEENFVGEFVWHKKVTGGYDNKWMNTQHEYIVVYGKNKPLVDVAFDQKESSYTLEDEEGRKFKWDSLWNIGGLTYSSSLDYTITSPDGTEITPPGQKGVSFWLWSKARVEAERDKLLFKKDKNGEWKVYKRVYASEGVPPSSFLDKEVVKGNTHATAEIKSLFGEKLFDYAKPSTLIKYLLEKFSEKNDTILDSFAGSGTTGQAVLDLNKEDGGDRRFILVQLPEKVTEGTPAHSAGFRWIHEITRERVKKVIEKNKYKDGFTYSTLGPSIDAETILSGKLPTYTEFAKYVYYLATGKNHPKEKDIKEKEGFVGKSDHESIYLLYEKDMDKLKKLAITLDWARETNKKDSGKKIVYAPACYLDDELLSEFNIKFVSIPYNLFEHKK